MNFPKCLYKENYYLIVTDEAHYIGAKAEGWDESHAHITGLPDRYLGKKPEPATNYTRPEPEQDQEINDIPPLDTQIRDFEAIYQKKQALRKGIPTKAFDQWREKHGYR